MGGKFSKNKSAASFTATEIEFFRKQSVSESKYDKVDWTEERRKRLQTMLQGDYEKTSIIESEIDDGSGAYVIIIDFDDQFRRFLQQHNSWEPNDSDERRCVVFFRQYPYLEKLKVLRRQRSESGLCYMHAPVVLQHYLVSINNHRENRENDLAMIDIAKYISTYWKDDKLLDYLARGNGGSSLEFLREINYHVTPFKYDTYFVPDPNDRELFSLLCDSFEGFLREKPGLVSNFEVDHDFSMNGVSFLDQTISRSHDPNKKNGRHAMVLIGIRRDPQYDYVFLLQNWWRGNPRSGLGRFFLEVSAKYMHDAGAMITFVNSNIPEIPQEFPKIYKSYAETSADVSEKMYER